MASVTVDKLAMAHSTAWRASHGNLLQLIPAAEAALDQLWEQRAADAQDEHDRWDRLASQVHPRVKGEGMRKKYNRRIQKRNECGQAARAARERRYLPGDTSEAVARQEAVIQSLKAEQAYFKRHYCEVRREYMEAIYEADLGLPEEARQEALERKLRWMRAAQVPVHVGAEEVRYYVRERPDGSADIHLFYGGNDGTPDGEGHAHHQLLAPAGGEPYPVFMRLPAA